MRDRREQWGKGKGEGKEGSAREGKRDGRLRVEQGKFFPASPIPERDSRSHGNRYKVGAYGLVLNARKN